MSSGELPAEHSSGLRGADKTTPIGKSTIGAAFGLRYLHHRFRQLVTLAGPAAVNDVSVPRSTVATGRKRGSRHVASSCLFETSDIELRARLVTAE